MSTYSSNINIIVLPEGVNQCLHGPLHDGESLAMDAATPEWDTQGQGRVIYDENSN